MRVLAAVPALLGKRLKHAVGRRFDFEIAATWDDAVQKILRRPVEMAIVDPALERGEPRAHEVERLRVLFPSLPIVLYTHFAPAVAPTLLQLGSLGVQSVVIVGHDDYPQHLSEVLSAEAAQAVSAKLIAGLDDLLAKCPGELRWAIETMIREPADVQSVQQLAERARMDRRSCVRWFARAELPPPSVVLTVLRVIYAHRLLQDPGYTVEDVAAKLGYAQTRTFAVNVKEVLGMTPGEIRVRLSPADALATVRARYFEGGSDADFAQVS